MMFGKKKTPMPTRRADQVDRRTLVESLVLASKMLSEIYGTCPFDQFDWKGCPVFVDGGNANACKNQTARCWYAALQDKGFDFEKH